MSPGLKLFFSTISIVILYGFYVYVVMIYGDVILTCTDKNMIVYIINFL